MLVFPKIIASLRKWMSDADVYQEFKPGLLYVNLLEQTAASNLQIK